VIACLAVPLSALANLLVKKPFGELVASVLRTAPRLSPETPDAFAIAVLVFGAFAEEVAKLLPFVVPQVRRRIADRETGAAGFVAGLGFGVGEILYLGASIASREEFATRSALEFQPFVSERIAATYLHALLTSIVLSAGFQVRSVGLGLCIAVGLHALANAGALLYQVGALPAALATLEFAVVLILATVVWVRLRQRASADAGGARSRTVLWRR
jgi:uncharacterized membrane protein YhfC